MPNPAVLEKQLLHISLAKGVNERDRPETADPATILTTVTNLLQDQAGGLVKRPGLSYLGGVATVDNGGTLYAPKLLRLRDGLGAVSTDNQFYQYQEGRSRFRLRGRMPDFSVKATPVTGSGDTVSPLVYSSSTSTSYHVMVHAAGQDINATVKSLYLTIYDRLSESIVAQYDLVSLGPSTSAALAVIVDNRYVHLFTNSASGVNGFVIDLNAALPSSPAGISGVQVNASPGALYDVAAGSGRSYVAYGSGATTAISAMTNATGVTTNLVGVNTLQISWSGTKLWYMSGTQLGALNDTTLAVSVAAAAHGGPATGYMVADASDFVWLASQATTTFGSSTIETVTFRKTTSTNSTTFAAVAVTLDGWRIGSTPFEALCNTNRSVYIHLTKDSGLSITPHVIVPMDGTQKSTCTVAGQTYTSMRISAHLEGAVGTVNGSVLRVLPTNFITPTEVGICIPIRTAARACNYSVFTMDTTLQAKTTCASFGGTSYITGGCHTMYGGGDSPVEVGFVDMPRVTAASSGGAGLPDGAYKYIAVYRYVDETGSVTWSRTSPIASVTVVASSILVNVCPPAVTSKNRSLGTTATPPTVTVELYRTKSGGTIYYLCASSAGGTPMTGTSTQPLVLGASRFYTVTDNLSDTVLGSEAQLFRQPGTPNAAIDRYAPPASNILCQHKDRLFTTDTYGTRVYYSSFNVDGETAWFNPEFSFLVHGGTGAITGMVSMDGRLFVFKRDGIFVVDGDGPAEGGVAGNEFSPPQRLATEYGCTDSRSLVVTTEGIVYRSYRGVEILTRSLQVKWLGDRVQNTVDANPETNGATLDAAGRVYMAIGSSRGTSGFEVLGTGAVVVYDFPSDCWTIMKDTAAGDYPSAVMANLGTLGETLCFSFRQGGVGYSDPTTGLDRATNYVSWEIETAWVKIGPQSRQRISKAQLLAKKRANHKITVQTAFNYSDTYTQTGTAEPNIINVQNIEEVETQPIQPESLSVRFKFTESAPTDQVTYPVTTARGCDVLGITVEIAQKMGPAHLASGAKV